MRQVTPDPSVGIDAETGRNLTGWAHVVQSLQDNFTTQVGTRIMREWYGSAVPNLLGRNINKDEVTLFFAAVTSAIEQWEPRYRVTRIEPLGVTRSGEFRFAIEGEYRPRAMLGDMTPAGARKVEGALGSSALRVQQMETGS